MIAAAGLMAAPVAALEGWSYRDGFFFMADRILSLSTPLTDVAPKSAYGCFIEVIFISAEIGMVGCIIGVVSGHLVLSQILSHMEGANLQQSSSEEKPLPGSEVEDMLRRVFDSCDATVHDKAAESGAAPIALVVPGDEGKLLPGAPHASPELVLEKVSAINRFVEKWRDASDDTQAAVAIDSIYLLLKAVNEEILRGPLEPPVADELLAEHRQRQQVHPKDIERSPRGACSPGKALVDVQTLIDTISGPSMMLSHSGARAPAWPPLTQT